jgi:hypothetical protein
MANGVNNGGYFASLTRWHAETGLNNPSVYCADYKLVIGRMQETLLECP